MLEGIEITAPFQGPQECELRLSLKCLLPLRVEKERIELIHRCR